MIPNGRDGGRVDRSLRFVRLQVIQGARIPELRRVVFARRDDHRLVAGNLQVVDSFVHSLDEVHRIVTGPADVVLAQISILIACN